MKLNKFSYTDKSSDWSLEEISFDRLTLLVGASGVGKTLILKAILALQQFSEGYSLSGVKWKVDFETGTGQNFIWEGEFENKGFQMLIDAEEEIRMNKPEIVKEKLTLNGKILVERTSSETLFEGKKTVKLSPQQSIVYILREEDSIKPAYEGFKKNIFSNQVKLENNIFLFKHFKADKATYQYDTLKEIQESGMALSIKLYIVSKADPETFNKIKDRFCEIFPQVQDLKIEPLDFNGQNIPNYLKDRLFIQIREIGVSEWIYHEKISSGMLRTLSHICEMYLCPKGTVFLIDEFENSLGINCIDEMTDDILESGRDMQFIITSHHPYIINNIDFSVWKLVTRKSGVVKTRPISHFISGKSKHDKFMQLIQIKQYETGTD